MSAQRMDDDGEDNNDGEENDDGDDMVLQKQYNADTLKVYTIHSFP